MERYNHPTDKDIHLLTQEYEYAVTIYRTFTDILTAELKRVEMETITRTVLKDLKVSDTVKGTLIERVNDELKIIKAHGDSFAVFISPTFVKIFNLPNRLNDEIKIGKRFNISNLLRAETFPQEGYILIANKDRWALYHGTKTSPAERVTIEQDKTLTLLTANNKDDNLGHIQQTSHKDAMKAMVPRYAQKLADTVKTIVNNTPTVVVADTNLMGELRKYMPSETTIFIDTSMRPDVNTHIVEGILRAQMEAFNQKIVDDFMEKAEKLESSDLIATDLTDIIHAAVNGKVDTLLIDRDWDEKAAYVNNKVTFNTEESIIPLLIESVLNYGGNIKVTVSEEMKQHNFSGIMAVKRFN
jgi:hypothetical protein